MKKLIQSLSFILLLSLTANSQNREANDVTHDQIVAQQMSGQQFNMNKLLRMDAFPNEIQQLWSPSRDWLLTAQIYNYMWDAEHSGWKNTTTNFYYYDANFNLDEIIKKSADGSEFLERNRYYYENNLLKEKRIDDYDSSEWIPSKKILYTYDVNNDNLIEDLTKNWENGEYVDYRKTTYTYDDDNNLYQYIAKYSNDGSNWFNSAKWTYFYDQNGDLDEMTNDTWDSEDSLWLKLSRNFLTRDIETGNLILMTSEYWDDDDNNWEEKLRQTYYYNDDGYMTSYVAVSWDDEETLWKRVFSQVYTYLPAGSEEIMVLNADINKSIEDFQTTEDVITIDPVKDNKTLIGVEVLIDSVLHTSDSDLEFTLSHNGITETIIYEAGGEGDSFINTTLSDRGVDSVANGVAPFYGIYKPENPLTAFLETEPSGTWTLSIYDGVAGNTGTLQSWGLNLIYASDASAVDDNIDKELDLVLFPNPAISVISLHACPYGSTVFSRKSAVVEIYDLNGRILLEQQIPSGTEKIDLDVSHLPCGVYFCRLSTANYSTTKKLIIQK